MFNKIKYEFDKNELDLFIEYEIAGHFLTGLIFWDSGQVFITKILVKRATRKYKRFLNLRNFCNDQPVH